MAADSLAPEVPTDYSDRPGPPSQSRNQREERILESCQTQPFIQDSIINVENLLLSRCCLENRCERRKASFEAAARLAGRSNSNSPVPVIRIPNTPVPVWLHSYLSVSTQYFFR